MQKELQKLTILHSNDIHGKFVGKTDENGKLTCSLAQVSGYLNKVKEEEDAVLYCIAGDVFQGSLIDSDFLGLSTFDILNMIDIDFFTLGNHELDYGISHMLFVEKCANFKILNANFRILRNGRQLFIPYYIKDINGIMILFIGLLTQNIIDQTKAEGLVGTYVTVQDHKKEVERICRLVKEEKDIHIDYTVVLTHIGYKADIDLAESLDKSCGVNLIIGGHSHTYLDEPTIVNDIMIVQAGMENTHLGRLDLLLDVKHGKIDSYDWKMIPVNEDTCPTDKMVKAMMATYVMDVDEKYSQLITRLSGELDNYGRGNPTECGQMFADAFCDALGLDVFLLASSSLRCYSMDMTVTLQVLRECYPYEGKIYRLKMTGKKLKAGLKHALRDDVLDNWVDVFYQTNKELHIEYNRTSKEIQMWFKGEPIDDEKIYNVGMQDFYFLNSEAGLGMRPEELSENGIAKVISQSAFQTIEDYLSEHSGLGGRIDDRIIITE